MRDCLHGDLSRLSCPRAKIRCPAARGVSAPQPPTPVVPVTVHFAITVQSNGTSSLYLFVYWAQRREVGANEFSVAFRPQRSTDYVGRGAQDGHLHFHPFPVQCCFTSTETDRLLETGNSGRPPPLSCISCTCS